MTARPAHSAFPPSAMHRLVGCAGSHHLSKLYPEREDSPEAMEGTAAHWVCAELLHGRRVEVGTLTPNGIAVTEDMIEGAEMYVDTVPEELIKVCHIEEPIDIPRIHPDCFGTPDLWHYTKQTIHVTDYKFGHSYVEVSENMQLIAYAAGILDYLNVDDQHTFVNFTIVQPRCFHRDGPVRSWSCRASDLRAQINFMNMAVSKVLLGKGDCTPGAWCNHCPATHACEALQKSTQAAFDFIASPVPSEMPIEVKGRYLAKVQQAMTMLKAIEGGLEEELEAAIRSGSSVPGYELRPGQGRVNWNKPGAEIAALGDMFGVDFRKEAFVTPTQAKALLKKNGVDESVISAYSERKSGELKLVKSDMHKLKQVFTNYKEQ